MARHHRQRDEDVFFLTGTDEHGEPVADAAKAQGLEPKELADRNAERFRRSCRASASRTTSSSAPPTSATAPGPGGAAARPRQRPRLQGPVRGLVLPALRGLQGRERDREGNRCPIHEIELVLQQEENWFFRLSTFQEPLERLYAEQPDFVMPRERYNEAKAFIDSGLQDVSLSRGR
jgi:methionyl-tRNA synthetase